MSILRRRNAPASKTVRRYDHVHPLIQRQGQNVSEGDWNLAIQVAGNLHEERRSRSRERKEMQSVPSVSGRSAPGPGQESVWDYPRPPRLERVSDVLRVRLAGETIAETARGYRVLETSHPPVYYFPLDDIRTEFLIADEGRSYCEFKGMAHYWTLEAPGARSAKAAWSYPEPTEPYRAIKDFLAFFATRVDECWVGNERASAQDGDFYGGWITSRIVGPFKGGPGTFGW